MSYKDQFDALVQGKKTNAAPAPSANNSYKDRFDALVQQNPTARVKQEQQTIDMGPMPEPVPYREHTVMPRPVPYREHVVMPEPVPYREHSTGNDLAQLAQEAVAQKKPTLGERIRNFFKEAGAANATAAEYQAKMFTDDDITPIEAAALGAAKTPTSIGAAIGSGIADLVDYANKNRSRGDNRASTSGKFYEDTAENRLNSFYDDVTGMQQQALQNNQTAYTVGSMIPSLAIMSGISEGIGSIKAFQELPQIARSIITGAASVGGNKALEEAGAASTGQITGGQYAKKVGIATAGGAVGGGVSGAVSNTFNKFLGNDAAEILAGGSGAAGLGGNTNIAGKLTQKLSNFGLANNRLARTIVAGLSGVGFAGGDVNTQYVLSKLLNEETDEMTKEEYMKELLIAFAFGSISYLAHSGGNAKAQSAAEKGAEAYKAAEEAAAAGNTSAQEAAVRQLTEAAGEINTAITTGGLSAEASDAAAIVNTITDGLTGGFAAAAAATQPTTEIPVPKMTEIPANTLLESGVNGKMEPTLAERVQMAEDLQSIGTTASEIFNETGLVLHADGSLSDGFDGPVVKEAENGRENAAAENARGNTGALQNAVRGTADAGGIGENGGQNTRTAFSALDGETKSRAADILRNAINESGTGALIDAVDDAVLNGNREINDVLTEYAGRIYDDLSVDRVVAEQKWGNTISNSGKLFDALEALTEEQAPVDDFSDIDPAAVREELEAAGIVNGQVVDEEALANSPVVQEMTAQAQAAQNREIISDYVDNDDFGTAGKKALVDMFNETDDPIPYLENMTKAYQAGRNGKTLDQARLRADENANLSGVNMAQVQAAFLAGQADATPKAPEVQRTPKPGTMLKTSPTQKKNAANRIIKSAKKTPREFLYGAWTGTDGKQYISDGYVLVRLNEHLEGLPQAKGSTSIESFVEKAMSNRNELTFPPAAEIKAQTKIGTELSGGAVVSYGKNLGKDIRLIDFGDGKPQFNAEYLRNVLELIPDATGYFDSIAGPTYFKGSNGDGVIMPVRKDNATPTENPAETKQQQKAEEAAQAAKKEEMTNEPAGVDRGSEVSGTGGDVERAVSESAERPEVSGNVPEDGRSGENGERNEQSGDGVGRIRAGNEERNAPAAVENPAGAGGETVTAAPVKKPAKLNKNNYRITEDIDSTRPRYEDNLAAIKLLKQLEAEGRKATAEERAILAKYKGWGGLKDAILGYHRGELQHLLTKEEYEAAKDSIINAHYTSTKVISGIYKAVARMGFTGGNILEPSMGVGNFFGMLPKNMSASSNLYGVELDKITGQIAQNLYPDAKIDIAGFQDVLYPDNTFDLVVGNVPFSNDVRIPYRGEKYNLHDFFFIKALDETKPGGVLALITSTGTLDKINGKTQSAISKRANLIAAFRLPDNAFKTNAGTSVTTDLIFLQKKGNGITDNGTAFTRVGTIDGIPINEYFVEHPKNILGTLAYEKGMYADNRTVVHATPDFESRFEKAMNSLPKGLMTADGASSAPAPVTAKKRGVREKTTFTKTKDGVSISTAGGKTESVSGKSAEIASEYLKIKGAYFSLIDAERAGNLEAAEQYRDTLNNLYDGFVKKYGPISKNDKLLKQDDDYIRVSGLEVVQKKGSIGKSAIFTTPTISRAKKTSAGSSEEALSISLNEDGKINLEHMAALTGKSPETVLKELDDEIIQTPDGEYVLTSQYLSGNIYEKLDAVQGKKGFERQAALLKASIPTPKEAKDISAEMGSHWIPAKYVAEFIRDTFSTYGNIDVEYNKELGQWDLGRFYTPVQKYSTERVNATDIIKNTLNGKNISVYDKDSDGRRILNKKATEAAQQKQNDLREVFRKWIFADNARRTDLESIFNRTLNAYAPMDYKGLSERIDFGISPDSKIKPRDYQKEAVARIVFGGNTLLHHGVGTGKTATMIMSAHVLKQSGISNKPMFVVPNGKVNDFRNEILGLYPDANILALDNKSMSPSELQHTKSMIATGDWDYVIIYRTAFEKIPVSPDTEAAFIQAQLDDMENALRENGGKKNGTTRFEKGLTTRKQTLEERLKAALDRPKDNSLNFEDLGIDALFIDEAHNYKKVGFATTHTISGIDSSTNNITTDLFLKENYIRNHGGRIVLATATPLTNTLSEMYNMTLHVNPEALRSAGIYSFDGWLNTFADIQSQPEIAPDGKTWRIKERVRGFKSGNELIGIYRQFADVKQTKDVVDDLPKAEFIDVVSEGTEYHQRLLDNFAERSGRPKDGKDNMLLITSDGRAAGTDLRLLTGLLQELYPGITADELDLPGSKINRAVENVVKEYNASTPTKGTQFVFLDVGIHDSDGRYAFNLYTDLIDKLAANGIPREEIANIQDYDGEEKRTGLYEAMNSGKIRVLIGSTAKMGEGVNAQNKSVALHHLNVPYRPDNLEQREGRTIRHGNENKNVRIYRYIQEKSFDSYLWQMIERKANYVAQALNGGDATSLEESSEAIVNAREAKAIATGNPLIMEKVELQDKISKLKLLQSSFYDEQRRAAQRIASNEAKIKELQTELAQVKKDAATVTKHKTDDFSMSVGGKTYDSRKEAGEAIAEQKDVGKIGSLYGLDVFRDNANEVSLRGAGKYTIELGDSPDGNITRLINVATKNILNAEARINRSIDALNVNTKDAQETVNSKFSRQDELDAAVKRQNEVDRELGIVENEVSFDDIAVGESEEPMQDRESDEPMRPERWTTTRISSGKQDAAPKSITEIVEGIRKNFGFNITAGHVRGSGVRGQFNPQDKGIRSKIINDLPTISHELGHALDNRYSILKNGLSAELKKELTDNLSDQKKADYPKSKWASEGLAEYVRAFLTNRETAAIDYPKFTEHFLKSLSGKDLALIEQLADDVNAYYSLGADSAAGSVKLREDGRPDYRSAGEKIQDMGDDVYQAWVDSNHGLKTAERAMGGDGRAYVLATNSAYSDAIAGRIITGDLTDANGAYVGPGLKTALHGVNTRDKKEYMAFNEYLVVRHGPERLAQGMRVFADDRKNSTEWMNKRRAALEAQYPEFSGAATRLIEFERQFNEVWGVGYGLIDKDVFASWGEKYQNHVPLNRAIEKGRGGARRGYANQNTPYKRAKGSGRDIIAPVDNIIDEIVRVVNTAVRNNVMLALRNTALKSGDANFMEKVPTPMKPKFVDMAGVKAQLQDAVEVSGIDPKALFTVDGIIGQLDDVLTQFERRGPYGNVITVLVGGKPEYWKINDTMLFESITNMTAPKMNAIMEAYGAATRFMTANITGNNAVWSIFSNAPRDLATFATYFKDKKNIFKAFGNIGSAYINSFKEHYTEKAIDPLYAEYLAMGGGQTSAYSADRDLAKRARKKLTGSKAQRVLDAANPVNMVSFITDTIEMGPRFATYRTLRKAGLDPQEAFYEAMDITVNFRRGGARAREVNKFFPFFNASVQGMDKFARFFTAEDQASAGKETRKKAVAGRWALFFGASAALAAINFILNQRDEDDEKNYRQLSAYTKNSYFNIPLGDGKYFAIPKPRELAVLTSLMSAGVQLIYNKDDHAFDDFYGYAVDQFFPSVISDLLQLPANIKQDGVSIGIRNTVADMIGDAGIIGVAANINANRDFLGKPIESSYMQYLEPKDRWNDNSSKIAYWMGQAFNVSPTVIDYFGNQVLGYLWKYQKALFPVGDSYRDWTLGVKNSYIKDSEYSTDLVNWLYDEADKSARAAKSDSENMEKQITSKMDSRMTEFYSNFNKINKGNTKTAEKRAARQNVLDMITDYRKATEDGTLTSAQRSIYSVIEKTGDTSVLPSVMNTYVKNTDDSKYNLTDTQYYEFQTQYLSNYYEYAENNLYLGNTAEEKAAILKAAKDAAKATATDAMLRKIGIGTSGYYDDFTDVAAGDVIQFKSKLDIADNDGSLKQQEVIDICLSMIENGLSYHDAYTLFRSKYESDKNNPWAKYK